MVSPFVEHKEICREKKVWHFPHSVYIHSQPQNRKNQIPNLIGRPEKPFSKIEPFFFVFGESVSNVTVWFF